MPRLNINCVICEKDFRRSDIIQSTYCGHIFHKSCLDNWKLRRLSCPVCQHQFSSQTFEHEVFLELDEREENPQQNENIKVLKTIIQSANERKVQLEDQLKDMEFNVQRLEEQLTVAEESKEDLQQQIREQNYSEDDFLDLQYECTNSTEIIKNLQQKIQELSIDTEGKCKELHLKCIEISQIKANSISPVKGDIIVSDSAKKVRILEEKLKHVGVELEKEIEKSTRLFIEKMKLECYIKSTEQSDCKC